MSEANTTSKILIEASVHLVKMQRFHIFYTLYIPTFINYIQQSHQSSYRRVNSGYHPDFEEPWGSQAFLNLKGLKLSQPNCTGTIITDLVVLTNAHCLLGAEEISIGIGAFDFKNLTFYQARYWVIHPIWNVHHLDLGMVVSVLRFRTVQATSPVAPRYWHTKKDIPTLQNTITFCGWGIDVNHTLGGLRCGQTPPTAPTQTCEKDFTDREQEW